MKKPAEVSQVIIKNIKSQFPKHHKKIIEELQWDSLNGCYYFCIDNIYYGVETDGYIHT